METGAASAPHPEPKWGGEDEPSVGRLRAAVNASGGPSDVAERARVSLRSLHHYLSGRSPMKLPVATAIARAAGVRLQWLATGEGPMHPSEAGVMEAGGELAGDDTPGNPPPSRGLEDAPRANFSMPKAGLGLAWQVHPDRMARAYEQALRGLVTLPGRSPDPRRLMQVTLLIYDDLTEAEDAAKRQDNGR